MAAPSEETLDLIAGFFRLLAEPTRLKILSSLKEGEKNVGQIALAVQSSQANVSKHLLLLSNSGILGRRQEGNTVIYSIANPLIVELCDLVCEYIADNR